MKNTFLSFALATLISANITLLAQEPATSTAPVAPTVSAVPASLAALPYITDTRPSADAGFYIYLSSASWCGPCRAIMPRIVAMYPEIKAAGGEIILLCYDRTPEAGVAYLKKYGADFPPVMATDIMTAPQKNLPGFVQLRGIPNAIFVSADGKTIRTGHGAIVLGWQEIMAK